MNKSDQYKWKVCVRCFTFNHSPYILDTLNGFCIQKTNFPFVCVIVDDASTDGEQDVIRHYLQDYFDLENSSVVLREETDNYSLIFAQHKNNKFCYFAVFCLKFNHYSKPDFKNRKFMYISRWFDPAKYIALCEGDDYWIDSLKLQKQVDFMECHPKHSLCIHAYRRDTITGDKTTEEFFYNYTNDIEVIPDNDVLKGTGMFAATASMVYRNISVNDYPDWAKRAPVGDRPLQLVLFSRGNIGYLNEVMSVYRVGVSGSWTERILRNKNARKDRRRRFFQMYNDFDEWTNGKYHLLIRKALCDLRKAILINDVSSFLLKPYSYLKRKYS